MATEVLLEFYDRLVNSIVKDKYESDGTTSITNEIQDITLVSDGGTPLVTLTRGNSDPDKEFTIEGLDTTSSGEKDTVRVTAVVSPSHTDVPTGTYSASVLKSQGGTPVTAELTHSDVPLDNTDDELTSIHEVQIPVQ